MRFLPLLLLAAAASAQTWVAQPSGTSASLRGVSAVNSMVVWASGSGGTYLKTTDGGANWHAGTVPGAEGLDFRDIQAFDAQTAYLLSSGTADKARIYKTTDGGISWTLQITNPDPKGFWDALAFWDADHGIVLGDPVDGHFAIFTTADGGRRWERRTAPPALPDEGAFAASGSCLVTLGKKDAWFATGGPGGSRVFHTRDRGGSWTAATTPIRNDAAAAGVFSLGFSNLRQGVAVGGDYTKAAAAEHNIAITADGGRTWTEPAGKHPDGFRSAVVFLPGRRVWIAAGTSGSDISADDGKTWKVFDTGAYNAVSFVSGDVGWAVGPGGRVAVLRF